MSLPEIFEQLFIEANIPENERDYDDLCVELFTEDGGYDIDPKLAAVIAKHTHCLIEGEYGGEGAGEYCYGVMQLDDKFYRAEWSYYSYNGCDYDSVSNTVREVKPREKIVTVYE